MKKNVLIKVYNNAGGFIGVWKDAKFEQFTKEINGGIGDCTVELGKEFDYTGSDLKLGNHVEILISDTDTLTSVDKFRVIYAGYISMINARAKGSVEGITITLLGHYTKLATDILKNSTQVKLYSDTSAGLATTAGGAADIGLMMRAVIDRYIAETTNPKISYNTTTIGLTSTTAEYFFEMKTYREAMDKLASLSPEGWYYYVNELGCVYFKRKPTTATHRFIFGKHFSVINVQTNVEKLRNALLFWNGEVGASQVFKLYSDAGSIAQHGRRMEKYYDYAIGSATEADLIGAKFIAENKNPEVKLTCEILDNNEDTNKGYDIESINVGDTCMFEGFDPLMAELFTDNMLISRVVYSLDKVEITVEAVKSSLVDWQSKTSKDVDDLSSTGSPETYST